MADLVLPRSGPGSADVAPAPGRGRGETLAAIRPWLRDDPFLDGTAEDRFGPRVARREALGRAQEHAHRLLERFFWGTDSSGRILVPGSRAEAFWLGTPPELDALARLSAAGPASPLLPATRAALAAPGPAAGPRRIAAVLAAFHRDLREAAPGLPGLVPGELRPAGPFDPARADTPERREVLAAGHLLGERTDLFAAVLVHGSYATLDERPGVSDLDLLCLLGRDAAEDEDGLLAAREAALSLWPILQRVDPLQHHGTFVLTPADLAFYPQVFLPLAVIREARVLAGPAEGFPVVLRPAGLPRRLTLLRAAEVLRRPLPDSLHEAKLVLQVVLLSPCFLLQAAGRYLYKRDSFAPFAELAPPAAARAVAAASRAREENLYAGGLGDLPGIRARLAEEGLPPLVEAAILQRHLLRPLPPALRDLLEPPAAADREALAALLEEGCPPLGGDPADDEFSPDSAVSLPVSRHGGSGEEMIARWRDAAIRYVEVLRAGGAVLAAWAIGTPGPGSDLDLVLVVDRERAREVDWTRCAAALDELSPEDRALFDHPPSAVLPRDLVPRMGRLSALFRCIPLFGEPPREEWWRVPDGETALALAADYVLAVYPGEMLRLARSPGGGERADRAGPAAVLRRVGAIRHTLDLVRRAGIEPPGELGEVVRRAREARHLPPGPRSEAAARLPGRAFSLLAELSHRIAARLEEIGFPPGRAGFPRVRGAIGNRVVLVEGAGPRDLAVLAGALEETAPGRWITSAAPLPLAWGFLDAVRQHAVLRRLHGPVPERIPAAFPPPPAAFRARWDAIAEHLSFLADVRCPGGWFYPNHLHADIGPFLAGDAP